MALEIMITVGGSDYYVSDEGHTGASFGTTSGSQYYFPFVAVPPRLTLGPTDGGYIQVQSGNLSLVNRPYDTNHPFSGTNYRNLLSDAGSTSNVPTIAIKDSTKYAIFDGTLIVSNFNAETINFLIEPKEFDFYLAEGTVTDSTGSTVSIPFGFGQISFMPNYPYKGSDVFANGTSKHPIFSGVVTPVLREATSSGGTAGTALYSSFTPTATTLTGSGGTAYGLGGLLVSGRTTKVNGDPTDAGDVLSGRIDTFAEYMAADLGLSTNYDTTKASAHEADAIGIWQTEKIKSLDLYSKVSYSINHQFFIQKNQSNGNDTLYLVDRNNNPTATELTEQEIISSTYRILKPLGVVIFTRRNYQFNDAYITESTLTNTSENLPTGRTINVHNYWRGTSKLFPPVQSDLDEFRDIEKKPIATVTLEGIKDTYTPGDRFTFNRKQDQVKVDLLTRSITWDWANRQTTLSGDATLSIYEDS